MPKRFPKEVMSAITDALHLYLNLRVGQLIVNAINDSNIDLLYIEDDNLVRMIEEFITKQNGRNK